jgi:hypothetical protein
LACPLAITSQALARTDYQQVIRSRRENFAIWHAEPDTRSGLRWPVNNTAVPPYHPFLAAEPVRNALLPQGLWIPYLWHDVFDRTAEAFHWERVLATRCRPLSVDQRYTAPTMREIVQRTIPS